MTDNKKKKQFGFLRTIAAKTLLWLMRPALSPLLADLFHTQEQIKTRMIDKAQTYTDPKGFIKDASMAVGTKPSPNQE